MDNTFAKQLANFEIVFMVGIFGINCKVVDFFHLCTMEGITLKSTWRIGYMSSHLYQETNPL